MGGAAGFRFLTRAGGRLEIDGEISDSTGKDGGRRMPLSEEEGKGERGGSPGRGVGRRVSSGGSGETSGGRWRRRVFRLRGALTETEDFRRR